MSSAHIRRNQRKIHSQNFCFYLLFIFSLFFVQPSSVAAEWAMPTQCSSETCENSDQNQTDITLRGKCKPREKCKPGPQGPRACPGGLNNYASYQFLLLPNQVVCPIDCHRPIAFGRQVVNRGFSIQSSPPFRTFRLAPGIYEITLGISTDAQVNQVQLAVGSEIHTFTPYAVASDFITYAKTIEIFSAKRVRVITTREVSFPTGNSTRLAAYINFIRID